MIDINDKQQRRTIVIYHKNCTDGFGAAWACYQFFRACLTKNVVYVPGVYGEPIPDVKDADVYMVDFSYSAENVIKLCKQARTVTIIDHHASSNRNLTPLKADNSYPNLELVFDTNKSGAVLTWGYFFPSETVPRFLLHIQDRDLWRFELDNTREIVAAIYSHEFDFEVWDTFPNGLEILITEGRALLRDQDKKVKQLTKGKRQIMRIAGFKVEVVNCPAFMASEVGHILAKGQNFAATYYDTADRRIFSLRSDPNGLDVSAIAEKFGGGGHKPAAGYSVPLRGSWRKSGQWKNLIWNMVFDAIVVTIGWFYFKYLG